MKNIKAFLVGGAVRDKLMGLEPKDKDYVVVGSNTSELLALGFEQVGMGFPVFLHPHTNEEYALARREKKVGAGYTGFEFETGLDVKLIEDLERRDLSINSMAIDDEGHVVDPFGGQRDLKAKVLRHTSFAFAEDPLRVVRLARFYARYAKQGFTVADETMTLVAEMVDRGDLNELPNERFWKECEKAFGDDQPAKFFELLFEIGALHKVEFFKRMFGNFLNRNLSDTLKLAQATKILDDASFATDVFAAWVSPDDPKDWFNSGRAGHLHELLQAHCRLGSPPSALDIMNLLSKARAWGDGHRADDFVKALEVWEAAHGPCTMLPVARLKRALAAGRTVTSEAFQHLVGKAIGDAMAHKRFCRISEAL